MSNNCSINFTYGYYFECSCSKSLYTYLVAFFLSKFFFPLMFVSCLTLGNRYLIIVKLGIHIGILGKSKRRGDAIVSRYFN